VLIRHDSSVKTVRIAAAIVVAAAVSAVGSSAASAAPMPATDTSTNWAGYTLTDTAAKAVAFTRATATWKEPALTCGSGAPRSAMWVGLGGVNPDSGELEQLGTNGNCASGKAQYSAFYDVIPNPGVIVKRFPVKAGDVITATISSAKGGTVAQFRMENLTTKLGFSGTVPVDPGARRSAEWIVEAPEGCNNAGCQQADLANFGLVSFTKLAIVGNGHSGTILDSRWHATAVALIPPHAQILATGLSHGAVPEALAANGSSFTIAWRSHTAAVTPPPATQQPANPKAGGGPYIAAPRMS
jgi:hypothetical protein